MGSWHWAIKTKTLTWSGELYKIYGVKTGIPLSFETFIERIHPDDRARVRATINAAIKEGKPFQFQERIVRPDAQVRVLDSQGDVELDKKGKVVSLFGFCRDVTEEQRSGEELLEQRELYEKLLGAQSDIGDGVSITDGAKLIYANEALARMYGYTINELKAFSSLLEIVVPEERDRLAERLRRRLAGENVDEVNETQVIRKDGKRIINEYAVKPVQVKGKTFIISIVRDVTEQRQAQIALREREQRFAKIFHASPVATILITLKENRILDANARFLELTGYSRKELVGHAPHVLSFGNSTKEHQRIMANIQEAKSVREVPVLYRSRKGIKSQALASIELISIDEQDCLLTLLWRV
jgi:PAS domain S-box-containing protein